MALKSVSEETLYLGIDGGGSKCRATVVTSEGDCLGTGLSGPANPFRGVDRALQSIMAATDLAIENAGLKPSDKKRMVAGMGLAGVNVPSMFDTVKAWSHPFRSMFLATDLHTACLGAHRGAEGAVIIIGTGSCGFASVNGKQLNLGGLGFPLGDQGSGAWMGLEAVKKVLLDTEKLGQPTQLTGLLENHCGCHGIELAEKFLSATPRDYAAVAPLIFKAAEQKDEVANGIIQEGADYLCRLACRLLELNPPRLSIIGGVSQRIRPWFHQSIAEKLEPPLDPPEMGAIYFAKQQLAPDKNKPFPIFSMVGAVL